MPSRDVSNVEAFNASKIAGNASLEIKESLGNISAIFLGDRLSKGLPVFGQTIQKRMKTTEISIQPKSDEPQKVEAKVIIEMEVGEEMLNGGGNVHGGCSAFLVDVCSTIALMALDMSNTGSPQPTVSQSLNLIYHSPATVGDKLKIINTTLTLGSRALSARTEVSYGHLPSSMSKTADFVKDLECHTPPFGGLWNTYQDGTYTAYVEAVAKLVHLILSDKKVKHNVAELPRRSLPLTHAHTRVMLDIPFEIWQHVTSFLKKQDLCLLYGVNHALYTIAMDERYRECKLGSLHHPVMKRNLARLKDAEIARRVRKLHLATDDLFRYIDMENREQAPIPDASLIAALSNLHISPGCENQKRMKRLPGGPPRPNVNAKEAYRDVLSIMSLLTSLQTLEIASHPSEHRFFTTLGLPSSITSPGWGAFRSTLRSLDLCVPVESLAYLLPPSSEDSSFPPLPHLTEFSLDILRSNITTNTSSIVSATVLPFLRSQRNTIIELSLYIRDHFDIGMLLVGISKMSKLCSLEYNQSVVDTTRAATDFEGLPEFLQTHSRQLTSFSFEATAAIEEFQETTPADILFADEGWRHLSLSALQALRISLFPVGPNHGLTMFIHRFASTLVSLSISRHFFIPNDCQALLDGFRIDAPLRTLRLALRKLTPSVLAMFASKLPALDTLQLQCGVIDGSEDYVHNDGPEIDIFAHELSRCSFPTFKLRNLILEDMFPFGGEQYPRVVALLKALPRLEFLSGRARGEYSLISAET